MKKPVIKLLVFVLLLAVFTLLFRFSPLAEYVTKEKTLAFFKAVRDQWWGPPVFILFYAAGCVLALPGSLLTLIGGAVFGLWLGTIYNLIAANLGASLAFFMARFFGRDFVKAFLKGKKLAEFDDKIRQSGFKTIFRLRLIPLVPFNGLNFGAGFSAVRFRDYLPASILGMIPGCFVYTYFADSLLQGIQGAGQKAFLNLIIASILLIGLSFLPAFFSRKKAAQE